MSRINLAKNIDMSKITFSSMNILKNGGKSVFINLNGGPLIVQTPYMNTPFGTTKFTQQDDSKGNDKWSLQLSLKDVDTNVPIGHFYKFLKELDESLMKVCAENSKAWFKKQYNEEILRELVTPIISYSKDKDTGEISDKYPPTFRLNIPMVDGNIDCECYDSNNEPVTLSTIEKGTKLRAIIQCSGIWFIGSKFGVSWKVIQLHVHPNTNISGFAFLDDGEEPTEQAPCKKKFIETSDDEEDPLDKGIPMDDEPEHEPEPDAEAEVEEPVPEPEPEQVEEEKLEEPEPVKKGRGKKK